MSPLVLLIASIFLVLLLLFKPTRIPVLGLLAAALLIWLMAH
jgi:hypothetical protein